jgi:hypothetical protein
MRSARSARLNGCACIVVAVGLTVLGLGLVWSGRQLGPRDSEALRAFRSDRSCTTALTDAAPRGDCSVVAAVVLVAEMRRSGGLARTPRSIPFVSLQFADGTIHEDELDGSDGRFFAETVRSGTAARAQLFRGTLVRVVSGSASAETLSAPDVAASSDAEMPWAGTGLIVIAALFLIAGLRSASSARGAP